MYEVWFLQLLLPHLANCSLTEYKNDCIRN
jgi:hypothetical protein